MLSKSCRRTIISALLMLALPVLTIAQVSVDVSVNVAPPELPVYDQPPIPGDGYVWTPGYWAWGDDMQDYYWVPGTWVEAPQPEYLWTPGYWAADGVVFFWHSGYWGPHVGFYGGVNYGYGYGGEGYEGGYWRDGRMYYNRSVNNISNTNITNVYNKTVINNVNETRVSYNGGERGVRRQPTPSDQAAANERHIAVTPVQREHVQAARRNPEQRASENNGRPPIAATPRATAFSGAGVIPASRGGGISGTPRGSNPNNRPAQPEYGQRQNRPAQPENRQAQPPQNRPAQPEYRQAQPSQNRPAQPEYRQSPPPPRQPPTEQRAPAMEPRLAPEQAQPRNAAPPPPPRQQAPPPRAEPARPAERPPGRQDERERH